jgi:uncharacterized membrane protein YphA (DoxX/SURF4 family)
MNESRNRVLTVIAVLLGIVMIGGGVAKLAGQAGQVSAFAKWGLPAWFRALVGTFEVIGGIGLVVPAARPAGAVILSTIMVGALWAHAAHSEWPSLIPAALLLTVFLTIFGRNRGRAIQLLGGV